MPFKISPLREAKDRTDYGFSPSIPQPQHGSFRVLLAGSTGSGKSTILVRLVEQYKRFFKKTVIWSPALEQFKNNLKFNKHDKLHSQWTEQTMTRVYAKHVARNKKTLKRNHLLLVFDDNIIDIGKNAKFIETLLNGRKQGVSFLMTTQRYALAAPVIRQNLSHVLLLSSTNNELRLLANYLGLPEKDLLKLWYCNVSPKKYAFMYIHHNPPRIQLSFTDKTLM